MGRRRYSGYHGRSTAQDVLRLIAALAAILLVLAAAVLIFGQRYIVYMDDGVRLELPFFRREDPSTSASSVAPEVVQLPRPEQPPEEENFISQP